MRPATTFTPSALPEISHLLSAYPPGIFSEKLHASIELMHRYTLELAADVLERLGVTAVLSSAHTPGELCRTFSFDPEFCSALRWLLDAATELGRLESTGNAARRSYRDSGIARSGDLASLRDAALALDPANAATLDLLDRAAALYPAVARREISADQALFDPEGIALWLAYFSNDNPTYAVNNWVAAVSAVERLESLEKLRILEVGAGAGSGSDILLRLLRERDLLPRLERYVVTEPSPFFLRRAQRELTRRYRELPLGFCALDINGDWLAQLGADSAFDLVYGVNVVHVAHDLSHSLAQARSALAPGGWLVIGECLRSSRQRPVFPELIFQILESFRNVRTDPDLRPAAGFLTPAQWRRAMAAARFRDANVEPDVEAISELCPNFLAGTVCGQNN